MTSDGEKSGRDVSGAEPSEDGIAALIEDRDADDPDQVGEIPAGNAGAVSYTHLTLPTIYSV